MALLTTPLNDLLDAFSSSNPTPGEGSAAALASALGTSLLIMVAGLPKTKHNSDEDRAALARAAGELAALRGQLADAIDADTAAYDAVVAAYKRPKESDEQKQARKDAVQRALKHATEVPLSVMRLSVEALKQADTVAASGNPGAASDIGVARALIRAGLDGARLNVDINLGSIGDAAFAAAVASEADRLSRFQV